LKSIFAQIVIAKISIQTAKEKTETSLNKKNETITIITASTFE
jgi:hypothetical protein